MTGGPAGGSGGPEERDHDAGKRGSRAYSRGGGGVPEETPECAGGAAGLEQVARVDRQQTPVSLVCLLRSMMTEYNAAVSAWIALACQKATAFFSMYLSTERDWSRCVQASALMSMLRETVLNGSKHSANVSAGSLHSGSFMSALSHSS